MGVQPEGVEGASGKPPPRLRRGETLCNIKGTTAQFVGSAGDAFSAICFLQKSRFTSSKPSISAIASYKKCIRHRTNSFVRYCLKMIGASQTSGGAEGVEGASADIRLFSLPPRRVRRREILCNNRIL